MQVHCNIEIFELSEVAYTLSSFKMGSTLRDVIKSVIQIWESRGMRYHEKTFQ